MADSPSSGQSPNDRTSGRQYQVSVKVLEASLGTKLSTYVEVALNSEKKRTRTIDSSDSPAWSETLDFAVSDSKWRVKFTLADASGAVLGVLALKAAELELNPKDPEWFNLEGSAAARISVIVQQREAIGKVSSNPTSERKKSPRPSSPSPTPPSAGSAKPALHQSNRSRDLSGSLLRTRDEANASPTPTATPAPAAEPANPLTASSRHHKKDKKEKKDKKDKHEKGDKNDRKDKKEKKRSSADLTGKKVTMVEPAPKETARPRTLSDAGGKPPAPAAPAAAAEPAGPQRDAFLAPTLTQKFKNFGAGRASPLVHTWELDSAELEFQQELGEGASAKVFKGAWRGQEVAIKVMKDRIEPKMLEDFKLEFNIMATIRSPNIVFFYGATLVPMLAIVLEYAHKGSLHDAMQSAAEKDSFTWSRSLKILEHALKGIVGLHSWKPQIVHRDLKSMNLLVDDNWNVKVGDFGLSRFTSGADQQSTLGKMRGTYAYVAPEVYFGAAFTPKADIYSMAVIMWEVVVRTVTKEYTQPYAEYPQIIFPFQIVIQTAKNNLRPTIPETSPPALTALIEQGWAKEPETRPTAQEMLERVRLLMKEYETHKEEWDGILTGAPTPQPKPADTQTPGAP